MTTPTAILTYEIRNTDTGYRAQGTYLGVTPETYGKMVQVLEGLPLQDDETARQLAAMKARKDNAYEERNRVVALLASMLAGSGTRRTAIEGWADDWHGCVYVVLPNGKQASWHYHDSQAHLFAHLPLFEGEYDGHSTELKYKRIAELAPQLLAAGDLIPQEQRNRAFYALANQTKPVAIDCPACTGSGHVDDTDGVYTKALQDVMAERRRQINVEGYSHRHDDYHNRDELAVAAAWYALPEGTRTGLRVNKLDFWPWADAAFKTTRGNRRRDLVKAAALLLAEIEAIDRAEDL